MVIMVNALAVRLMGRLRLEAMGKVQRSGLAALGVSGMGLSLHGELQ